MLTAQQATMPDADPAYETALRALMAEPAVRACLASLEQTDERTLLEQAALTAVPAPSFKEEVRARHMAELMAESGLVDIRTDAEGNVRGWLPHPGPGPEPVVMSAHLDTVFPEGTDVTVRRVTPHRLEAPGIGDDGRGLAAILAVSRALIHGGIRLRCPLMVVATVGEEGPGNLRGVRYLTGPEGSASDARAFLSLDGAGHAVVVNQGVGSRRFRVTVTGPGGHSWMDYGAPNPIHALGDAIARFNALDLGGSATLSVGRVGGGTSVNAIPEEAWTELEIRSREPNTLEVLEHRVRAALVDAIATHNIARRDTTGPLALAVVSLGVRAAGFTPTDAPVVRAAVAATRALGYAPRLTASSTDANAAMAAGIPSVTLGAGGDSGGTHTLGEWYDNTEGPSGLARGLLTVLLLDRMGG